MDFAINREGILDNSHAKRYKELGSWINRCYGTPISNTSGTPGQNVIYMQIPKHRYVDRLMLQEDMTNGQIIRSFAVFQLPANSQKWEILYTNDFVTLSVENEP